MRPESRTGTCGNQAASTRASPRLPILDVLDLGALLGVAATIPDPVP